MGKQAVIVFTNENTHWIAKFLHGEVNHCFLCVMDRGKWIVFDPTLSGVDMYYSDKLPLGVYYQPIAFDRLSISPMVPTCVGLIKKIAGIRNVFILTPWQLLKHVRHRYGRQSKEARGYSARDCIRETTAD